MQEAGKRDKKGASMRDKDETGNEGAHNMEEIISHHDSTHRLF